MLPVSAAELLAIQLEMASVVCDQPCQIWRKSSLVPDGYGTQSNGGYTLIATTTAGMSQPSGGQLQNYDYLIGSLSAWQVHLPYGTNVQHQDHLVIDSQTLEVQILLDPQSYQVLLTVLASEIE